MAAKDKETGPGLNAAAENRADRMKVEICVGRYINGVRVGETWTNSFEVWPEVTADGRPRAWAEIIAEQVAKAEALVQRQEAPTDGP